MSNGKICGDCIYWHQVPIMHDANGIAQVGMPRPGECRHSPPTANLIAGPQGVQNLPVYPLMMAEFRACGQHEHAEAKTLIDSIPEG